MTEPLDPWQSQWPALFRALADPGLLMPPLDSGGLEQACASWGALHHALRSLLGWNDVGRGLAWWYAAGRPVDDSPVLALVQRSWGREDLLDYYAGILERLGGRSHVVQTAVCLLGASGMNCVLVETEVEFMPLSRDVCEAYLDTAEPWDKAGAYAVQAQAALFIEGIEGDYWNVVGLPISLVYRLVMKEAATMLAPE